MTREELRAYINARIYTNDNKEITAAKHNEVSQALADYSDTLKADVDNDLGTTALQLHLKDVKDVVPAANGVRVRFNDNTYVTIPAATTSYTGAMTPTQVIGINNSLRCCNLGGQTSLFECDAAFLEILNSAEHGGNDYSVFIANNGTSYQDVYYFARYNTSAHSGQKVVRFNGGEVAFANITDNTMASDIEWKSYALNEDLTQEISDRQDADTAVASGAATALLNAQIARYSAFGATYDNGTWSMHGGLVTGLTAADMEKICASPDFNSGAYFIGAFKAGKTNRPVSNYRVIQSATLSVSFNNMCNGNRDLVAFEMPIYNNRMYAVNYMGSAFANCPNLRSVRYLDVTSCTTFGNAFFGCSSLTELRMSGLKNNLDLSACANLSDESILFLIENALNTSEIVVNLHPDITQDRRDVFAAAVGQHTGAGYGNISLTY